MIEQSRVNKFSREERRRNNYFIKVNMLTEDEFVLILSLELEQVSIYLDYNS